jgi:hypothetical protein
VLTAQFYYKDILNGRILREEVSMIKTSGIKSISVDSYEEDGRPSKGFFCKKQISKDFRKIEMGMRSPETAPSLVITLFNESGSILSTYDSSDISVKNIHYLYDASGRIQSIVSRIKSSDEDFVTEITEEHIYSYNLAGMPEKMILKRNGKEISDILFALDEQGRISIEKEINSGKSVYYYYDSKSNLTDIVRENERTGKMLPDYMFEYDEKNRLIKMLNTEDGSSNYLVWLYFYNENGLKSTEKIYSKERKLIGRLEYTYKMR